MSPSSEFEVLSREELVSIVLEQRVQIAVLTARVAELERLSGQGGGSELGRVTRRQIKPQRAGGDKSHKKRGRQFFRRVDKSPTDSVMHACDRCPDCGHSLSGGWLHRRREVIELCESPFSVTEHRIYGRWCGICGKRVLPKVDLSDRVVGKRRMGIRLMSWISYLHTSLRIPLRPIQRLLKSMFGLHVGLGELTELMHAVANRGAAVKAELLHSVRGSPYVHADETGWREDGVEGYLWSFSTPEARIFSYNKSRSGTVAEEHLGLEFNKILVSDFYVAYNRFACAHQRCWVHLLRDLHALKENFAADARVREWTESVEDVYRRAVRFRQDCLAAMATKREQTAHGIFERKRRRRAFELELTRLGRAHARQRLGIGPHTSPQCVLAERCVRFADELFVFVEHPNTPPHNNPAETAIRPAVIARKVSGGTRSDKGSQTLTTLMSLLATWQLQGQDPVNQCANMLAAAQS